MTFSDAGVVKLLKKEFVICWQSVCDVRKVEFDLGNGRKSLGILNGELAVHVCDVEGKSFNIIPGLRSPVEMANKLKKSVITFKKRPSFKSEQEWQQHIVALHQAERLAPTEAPSIKSLSGPMPDIKFLPVKNPKGLSDKEMLLIKISEINNLNSPNDTEANPVKNDLKELTKKSVISTSFIEVTQFNFNEFNLPIQSLAPRQQNQILQPTATIGLRDILTKGVVRKSAGPIPTSTSIIVNPGNTSDYDKNVTFAFQGSLPKDYATNTPWDIKLKTPSEWTKVLFEGIMKQKMQGGSVKYESVRGTPFTLISK